MLWHYWQKAISGSHLVCSLGSDAHLVNEQRANRGEAYRAGRVHAIRCCPLNSAVNNCTLSKQLSHNVQGISGPSLRTRDSGQRLKLYGMSTRQLRIASKKYPGNPLRARDSGERTNLYGIGTGQPVWRLAHEHQKRVIAGNVKKLVVS